MKLFIGQVLPFISIGVFLAGTVARLGKWLRTPAPFHLTLFPVPKSPAGKLGALASEFFLCRTLFRHDKALWLFTWLFHMSLAMVLAGHAVGIYFLRNQFILLGLDPATSRAMSLLLGGTMGTVMTLSLAGLFCRRIVCADTRRLSEPENFVLLLLLLAVALSGMSMYLPGFHVDLPAVRDYMGGIFSTVPVSLPPGKPFLVHFVLVNVLLLYFPFSRMVHSLGFFVIRVLLLETPPRYPTPAGTAPRSIVSAKKLFSGSPLPKKTLTERGDGNT